MTEEWSPARRVAFRFVFVYLLLFNVQLGVWTDVVPWFGKHVLHLGKDITIFPNGSGDTTFNYVQVLLFLIAALLAAASWSLFDRRSRSHPRLEAGLRIFVRYVLASTMVTYGLYKVFKTQFPFPHPDALLERYGDSSPMRLLWTFMGYSTSYTVFGGLGEVAGGLLLLSRKTTTLGALIVAAMMTNVVMLNLSYDVPVKLYSIHLLLMAVLIIAPDARRLADVFVLNRPVSAVSLRTPLPRWLELTRLAAKLSIIGFVLFMTVSGAVDRLSRRGDDAPKPALYGIYEVEEFTADGAERPPLLTDRTRWSRLVFDMSGFVGIQVMDESDRWFRVTDDPAAATATLTTPDDDKVKIVLKYARPDAEHLVLQGLFEGGALTVRMKRRDESSFLLVNRGFHWINEYPFNQ